MKIDMHSHFFPDISQAEAARLDPVRAPWLHKDGARGQIMVGDRAFRPVHDHRPAHREAETAKAHRG